MVVVLTESVVNEDAVRKYISVQCGGFTLIVDETNGFFNGTQLCVSAGKDLNAFKMRNKTFRVCASLKNVNKLGMSYCTNTVPTTHLAFGTYYHPIIFIDIAMWCRPEFYVKASLIVLEYFNSNVERARKLEILFKRKPTSGAAGYDWFPMNGENSITMPMSVAGEPHFTDFAYAGINVTMKNNWGNATKLTCRYNKQLCDFEKMIDVKTIMQYLTMILQEPATKTVNLNIVKGVYYHPILFLKLSCWVNIDFYEAAVSIVLTNYTNEKKMLVSRNRAPAKPMDVNEYSIWMANEMMIRDAIDDEDVRMKGELDMKWKIKELESSVNNLKLQKRQQRRTIETMITSNNVLVRELHDLKDAEISSLRSEYYESEYKKRKLSAKNQLLKNTLNKYAQVNSIGKIQAIVIVVDIAGSLYIVRRDLSSLMNVLKNLQPISIYGWYLMANQLKSSVIDGYDVKLVDPGDHNTPGTIKTFVKFIVNAFCGDTAIEVDTILLHNLRDNVYTNEDEFKEYLMTLNDIYTIVLDKFSMEEIYMFLYRSCDKVKTP
jgi:hypothetical protein